MSQQDIERGELITPSDGTEEAAPETESVQSPAKVMRIGTMVKQLLDEVKAAPLDDRSRERLTDIYQKSVQELGDALSPDLQAELQSFALPFADGAPSDAELRIAQAQLVGWLEGLFHGIQATLFTQQAQAQSQLDEMRQRRALGEHTPGERTPGAYL
jgi:hypothetical protein